MTGGVVLPVDVLFRADLGRHAIAIDGSQLRLGVIVTSIAPRQVGGPAVRPTDRRGDAARDYVDPPWDASGASQADTGRRGSFLTTHGKLGILPATKFGGCMDLARFSAVVRHSIRMIVLITMVAAATTFIVSELLPRQYESEARVLIGSVTDPNTDKLNAYQQLAQTFATLATTTPLLTRVAEQLGLTEDPTRLALAISVRAPLGQSIVRIVATGSSASDATQLANAVAEQVTELGRPTKTDPSIVSVVQPAIPPDGPSSPRVFLNTLVAAALGVALGIGIAILRASMREDQARDAEAPVPPT
jgi:capsular polysaccharide biosynthesis protein